MSIPATEYAQRVFNELQSLQFILLFAIGDNNAFNDRLTEEHEQRKAAALESLRKMAIPMVLEGENVEDCISYTGTNPADENGEYTRFLERTLSETVVCRSVDMYHWYLRRVLQLALDLNPSLFGEWAEVLGIGAKKLASIERGENRNRLLAKLFRGSEKKFRELVHDHLNIPLKETIGAYIEIRNRLVHDLGDDTEGLVAAELVQHPDLGVEVKDGRIIVDVAAAYTAPETLIRDISVIDQCLAGLLSLPTSPSKLPNIKRCA